MEEFFSFVQHPGAGGDFEEIADEILEHVRAA